MMRFYDNPVNAPRNKPIVLMWAFNGGTWSETINIDDGGVVTVYRSGFDECGEQLDGFYPVGCFCLFAAYGFIIAHDDLSLAHENMLKEVHGVSVFERWLVDLNAPEGGNDETV